MAPKNNIFKRPEVRLGLVISALMIALSAVIVFFWVAKRSLFSKNLNFTLQKIVIKSTGYYWKTKDDEIKKILDLNIGSTNLFELKLPDIRKKLEQQSDIEKASAERILPDTLLIEIVERIPRAFLYSSLSGWMIDSTGIVMDSKTNTKLKDTLPVITGFKTKESPHGGMELFDLKPAVGLIILTLKEYPDIKINTINLCDPDEIHVYFTVSNISKPLIGIFPRTGIEEKMKILHKLIKKRSFIDNSTKTIDLRFTNRIVTKTPK